jgi:5-methylcytosine-specific restriction endonuclease McrA
MKVCIKCNERKEYSEFHKRDTAKDGYRNDCKACVSARSKGYYQANPDKYKNKASQWREENSERKAAADRAWQEANPEKVAEYRRRTRQAHKAERAAYNRGWIQNNAERSQAYHKQYRADNRDKLTESRRAWREANKSKVLAYDRDRRARVRNQVGYIKPGYWEAVLRFYGGKCLKCGTTEDLTLDHVIPLSLGGLHELRNFQILCGSCNYSKQARSCADYRTMIMVDFLN